MLVSSDHLSRHRWQLHLLKVVAGQRTRVTIVSDRVAFFGVHWVGGRAMLCADLGGECDCDACQEAPLRTMGCVVARAALGDQRRLFLLEASSLSFSMLNDALVDEELLLSGAVCDLYRRNARSRLVFDPVGPSAGQESEESRSALRQLNALAVLYGLPVLESLDAWQGWCRSCSLALNQRLRTHLARDAG